MLAVSADETRLIARAELEVEREQLGVFPGARWIPARGGFSLPRQVATFRLLDRQFGRDGWEVGSELLEEVQDARGASPGPAIERAVVEEVSGNEVLVRCRFEDRELVKQVPGYRWVPQEKRWRLPLTVLTLEILREAFGAGLDLAAVPGLSEWEERERLEFERRLQEADQRDRRREAAKSVVPATQPPDVSPTVTAGALAEESLTPAAPEETVRTAAADAAVAGTASEADAAAAAPAMVAALQIDAAQAVAAAATAGVAEGSVPAGLYERLDRLVAAIEELVAVLKTNGGAAATRVSEPDAGTLPAAAVGEAEAPAGGGGLDWRAELERLRSDHGPGARSRLEAQLAAADQADRASWMALIGLCCQLDDDAVQAFEWFRRAIGAASDLDGDLRAEVERGFGWAAWQQLQQALGMADGGGNRAAGAARALMLDLLGTERIAGEAWTLGREVIDRLATDEQVLRVERELHELARLAQFIGAYRARRPPDLQRLEEFARAPERMREAAMLALILLAVVLYEVEGLDELQMAWPREVPPGMDFRRAAAVARQSSELVAGLGEHAAYGALAVIATGPADWANQRERLELVRRIPVQDPRREHAEFLAAYALAAAGVSKDLQVRFKGYVACLKRTRLDDAWGHLEEVLANDDGPLIATIVDDVLPVMLMERGIAAPDTLLQALQFADGTPRGDRTLNAISDAIEDGSIPGAEQLDGEQRLEIFRLALTVARKKGHDKDAEQAFVRMIRELTRLGREDAIPNLCEECFGAFPALKERSLLAALEFALERGAPFVDALERAMGSFRKDSPLLDDFRRLAAAFPELRERGGEKLEKLLGTPREATPPDLRGKSVLVVGGHPQLKAKCVPRLEELGLQVEWLDAEEAKQGDRAVGSAGGKADLVVINAQYIGHAASGRVREAAERAKKPYVARAFAGPTMLVATVVEALAKR